MNTVSAKLQGLVVSDRYSTVSPCNHVMIMAFFLNSKYKVGDLT